MTAKWVPAGPVREVVAARVAAGVPYRRIAEHAGRDPAVVRRLLWGRKGRPPTAQLSEDAAAALLAAAGTPVITPAGARRRLQALCAAGYSLTGLARRIGADPDNLRDIAYWDGGITPGMCERLASLFGELHGRPPAENTRGERVSVARARGQAARYGWATWEPGDAETVPAACLRAAAPKSTRRPKAAPVAAAAFLLTAGEDLGDLGPTWAPFCAPRSWRAEYELEMADALALDEQARELVAA